MELVYHPHDLLWINTLDDLSELPAWFNENDLKTRPVVVRRAPKQVGRLAVGIRGVTRSQRHGSYISPAAVYRSVTPESIVEQQKWSEQNVVHPLPHWQVLVTIDCLMRAYALTWGLTGSLAFELATGIHTANEQSDIDLRLLIAEPIDKAIFLEIQQQLQTLPLRPDIQIETPIGAFAMNEWLGTTGDILIKTDLGPFLTAEPWQPSSI